MPDFEITKNEEYIRTENIIISALDGAGFNFISAADINTLYASQETIMDVLQRLIDEKVAVRLNNDLYTLQKYIDEAKEKILKHFENNKVLTIAQVRDIFQNSRKSAKPLLQYMDTIRVTRKVTVETEREAFINS